VKIPFFQRINSYHIHVNYEDRNIVFSRKSRRLPKVNDEYIVYFEGRYRLLRATQVFKDPRLKVIAEVE